MKKVIGILYDDNVSPDNFREKLLTTYLKPASIPTPCQIQKHIGEQALFNQISEETGIEDINFLKKAFHPDGRFLQEKYLTFVCSLKNIPPGWDSKLVGRVITSKCLRSSGEINLRRLKRLIKRSN